MLNQPLYHAGDYFINESALIPIYMEDQSGVQASGFSHADLTVYYGNSNSAGLLPVALSVSNFTNMGRGLYLVEIPASGMTPEGPFLYVADAAVTGYTTFRGAGVIKADFFEVKVTQQYDYSMKTLTSLVWLERNGQIVTTPIDGRETMRESGSTIVSDVPSSSPNSEGVFTIVHNALDLDALKTYEILGMVSYNGTSYKSVTGTTTFN